MKLTYALFALVILTSIQLVSAKDRNLVVNGSFEEPVVADNGVASYKEIPGWTTTLGDGIEVQHNCCGEAYERSQLVELDGQANSAMRQAISTMPGLRYRLSFWYSPRPSEPLESNGIEVLFEGKSLGTIQQDGIGLSETKYTKFTYEVIASSTPSFIEFRAVGASNGRGGYLDNVRFEK